MWAIGPVPRLNAAHERCPLCAEVQAGVRGLQAVDGAQLLAEERLVGLGRRIEGPVGQRTGDGLQPPEHREAVLPEEGLHKLVPNVLHGHGGGVQHVLRGGAGAGGAGRGPGWACRSIKRQRL